MKLAVLLARGARSRLLLLALCALLGVAGRVAVDVLGQRIDAGLAREARTLLGGDVELSASRPLSAAQREAFHAALPPGTVTTSQRTLLAMAAAGERARTAEVRAVDPAWPLSGAVRLAGGTLDDLHGDQPAVLCEAGLLAYLGVEVGDTLRLGGTPFRIAGRLEALPGAGISFAPRLLVGARHLDATPLAGASSRVRHALLARFADPADADAVAGRLRAALGVPTGDSLGGFSGPPREPLAVRTAAQAQVGSARLFGRIADWLRLASLSALLLAALGIGAAAHGWLAARAAELVTLRVLGVTPRRLALAALAVVGAVGAAGGLAGGLAGFALASAALAAAGEVLPLGDAAWWRGPLLGALLGAALAAAAVLPALSALTAGPPLAAGRGTPALRRHALFIAIVLAVAAVALGAWEARSWRLGGLLVGVVIAGGALVAALVRLLRPLLRALAKPPLPLGFRLGLADAARPAAHPLLAAAALGGAAAVLAGLACYRGALDDAFTPGSNLPSRFVLDLRRGDLDPFRSLARAHGVEPELAPLVRARLVAGGSDPGDGRDGERGRLLRAREQNLSWREQPDSDERIVEGAWMAGTHPVEASVERAWARDVGVGLGDELVFDVQGIAEVRAVVTSVRQVRWLGFRPQFFVLLTPPALDGLPVSWLASLPALPTERAAAFDVALAAELPEATAIDLGEVLRQVLALVDRVLAAVLLLAAVAAAAGLAVIAGMALAQAEARRADAALLRALGARQITVRVAHATAFAVLGGTAALVGGVVGALAVSAGLWWLADLPPVRPWGTVLVLTFAGALAATIAGALAARGAWKASPAEALRGAE